MIEILTIIAVNLLFYTRTIWYLPIVDDVHRYKYDWSVPKNKWQGYLASLHSSRQYRMDTRIEHAISIAIHTTVCILIYITFGANNVSFLAGVLFAVNPVTTQVSCWMNGKRYGIVTIMCLLMWMFKPWGGILYLALPYWQMSGITMPVLYLFKGYWWAVLPMGAVLLLIFNYKNAMNSTVSIFEIFKSRYKGNVSPEAKTPRWKKLRIYVKAIGYNMVMSLVPWKLAFFHTYLESWTLTNEDNEYWYSYNKHFWMSLGLIVVSLTIMAFNWSNPIGFGIFWWYLFISQWCHFPITIMQAITERYCYLPTTGLMYALAYALMRLPQPVQAIAITVVLSYYVTRLLLYVPQYHNIMKFYQYNLGLFPDHPRVRQHMARKEVEQNKWMHAVALYGDGLLYRPRDCMLNFHLAKCLHNLGFLDLAKKHYQTALEHPITGIEDDMKNLCETNMTNIDNFLKGRKKQENKLQRRAKRNKK